MGDFVESVILVLLGAAVALVGPIISSRLTLGRERSQFLWNRELDRFFDLEELAGSIAERLGGYRPIEADAERIASQLQELDAAAGRFRRYPEVTQAIRDFANHAGWIFHNRAESPSPTEQETLRAQLGSAHTALLEACDQVLRRE